MSAIDDFWDDVLGHIRQQVMVPVTGPDLTVVNVRGAAQTLTRLVGEHLAERYDLDVSPGPTTMDNAVGAFLRERGRDEVDRLYRVINDMIADLDPVPGDPLRDLATITDLRLFVSTTPDRLLAQALNDVRFQGRSRTRELTFSPTQSTSEQSRNARAAMTSDVVVLRLFGQTASTPQYAIHEEDRLEWLHSLLTHAASLPDWLNHQLKYQPLLFVGCDIPDWIGRFLLRMSSNTRLALERKQFFFVGSSTSQEPSLSNFFAAYCRKAQVQQLDMAPTAFVAELRARWEKQGGVRSRAAVGAVSPQAPELSTIFISYMREDADAARRLRDAIAALGGDVWLDDRRLRPGDAWEHEILSKIRRTIRLFVAVISANTEREEEGYVFREWMEAVERARSIPRRRFIVPVIVDDDYDGDPSRYQQIPDDFGRYHFGRAPAGDPDADLLDMLTAEIRAMRRSGAA